ERRRPGYQGSAGTGTTCDQWVQIARRRPGEAVVTGRRSLKTARPHRGGRGLAERQGLSVQLFQHAPGALPRWHRALQVDLAVVTEQVARNADAGRRIPGRAAGEQPGADRSVRRAELVDQRAAGPVDIAFDTARLERGEVVGRDDEARE